MKVNCICNPLQNLKVLNEVYKVTDMKPVENVLKAFINFVNGRITITTFQRVENDNFVLFDFVNETSDEYLVSQASYNSQTGFTTIYLFQNTLDRLQSCKQFFEDFKLEVYSLFTHEDTHKQQSNSSKITVHVPRPETDPEAYAKHYREIDAYARQCGSILKQTFPNLNVEEILQKVNERTVPKLALDKVDLYKLPNFRNKESNRFFHTLYEYLNSEV